MASASSFSLTLLPSTSSISRQPSLAFTLNAMPRRSHKINTNQFVVRISSSVKVQAVMSLTAAAIAAAFLDPHIVEAAQPGISSSLKNFLLSIALGGGAIIRAVAGVSNFDPVKRA